MKQTEIRNVLGVYDDPLLNAACECERKDELAENIAHTIVKSHGYNRGLYNGDVFNFQKVCKVLKEFGFSYVRCFEKEKSHFFKNHKTGDKIYIYPVFFYPELGNFRFDNFHVM